MTETALYRHFSKDGMLLYVGISIDPFRRNAQHEDGAPWFREVTNISVEWHPTHTDALRAEQAAIAMERPRFNKEKTGTELRALHGPLPPEAEDLSAALGSWELRKVYRDGYPHFSDLSTAVRTQGLHGWKHPGTTEWKVLPQCFEAWARFEPCEHRRAAAA